MNAKEKNIETVRFFRVKQHQDLAMVPKYTLFPTRLQIDKKIMHNVTLLQNQLGTTLNSTVFTTQNIKQPIKLILKEMIQNFRHQRNIFQFS